MGANSKIGWTHHTWNLWRGCTEVPGSPACVPCYARELAKRNPAVLGQWGAGAPRVLGADDYRRLPLKWNVQAAAAGERHRVFALSMGDWLDDEVPAAWLAELLVMIHATPHLDWLLLTKRPQNFDVRLCHAMNSLDERAPRASVGVPMTSDGPLAPASLMIERWYVDRQPPANVWFGITGENREWLWKRWGHAQKIPAAVHFLSMEPLYEDVSSVLEEVIFSVRAQRTACARGYEPAVRKLWVIAGGESGHRAEPVDPEWVRGVRDVCQAGEVPFFFKQWGEWAPGHNSYNPTRVMRPGEIMTRFGTKEAGHRLDGRDWQEFPTTA